MSDAAEKSLHYPCWVSSTGDKALRWGAPCDGGPGEALRVGRAEVDAGRAVVAFVVRMAGGRKTPLTTYVYPMRERAAVIHWEALWGATDHEQRQ